MYVWLQEDNNEAVTLQPEMGCQLLASRIRSELTSKQSHIKTMTVKCSVSVCRQSLLKHTRNTNSVSCQQALLQARAPGTVCVKSQVSLCSRTSQMYWRYRLAGPELDPHSVRSLSLVRLFATPGLQHTRPPCPPPTPGAYSNSCPPSRWCHPTTSSSVVPFSSRLQYFPASGSVPMTQFFLSCCQSTGAWAWPSASVLPINIHDWFNLGLILIRGN